VVGQCVALGVQLALDAIDGALVRVDALRELIAYSLVARDSVVAQGSEARTQLLERRSALVFRGTDLGPQRTQYAHGSLDLREQLVGVHGEHK